jgi:hypothetical protein
LKIRYTQKQIDKHKRQKQIADLEKTGKNLFRMFRDKEISASNFITKFTKLREKRNAEESVPLDMEYYRELESYIDQLYRQTVSLEDFDDEKLDLIREREMGNLNRLQKLKNSSSYKKTKHKNKQSGEWGE